jgi:hypothetical protein
MAEIAKIESAACSDTSRHRCEVVTLYGGGQYELYKYRKYTDVRLVFAPEYQIGQFGGVPDYFNFPRYSLDAVFLRLYEGWKPVATPNHLRWRARAPVPGEPVFVAGYPGRTQRLATVSELALRRELVLPVNEFILSEQRGWLTASMSESAEKASDAAAQLFEVENSLKGD